MRDITCERCGGVAIRSPLCGSCAYALGEVAWQRIKARIAPTVSDEVLDHWMDTHKDNPANQTYGGWLLTQNGYIRAKVHQAERTGGVAGTSLPVEEQSGVQLPSGPPDPANKVTVDEAKHWLLNSCPTCLCDPCQCLLETDPTNTDQQRHEDAFSFEQFRDAQGRAT